MAGLHGWLFSASNPFLANESLSKRSLGDALTKRPAQMNPRHARG